MVRTQPDRVNAADWAGILSDTHETLRSANRRSVAVALDVLLGLGLLEAGCKVLDELDRWVFVNVGLVPLLEVVLSSGALFLIFCCLILIKRLLIQIFL